ncbi:23774_t:CDS:2 [Gigaspora margarita]|uniref:23774_t:CDS:1 n=1 Tax=Gigaspora margarita TaxID=4874 RepID=A0ABN7UF94_GIGMA|nr:23774_t:CDS:2 [Gigaspora margarita]
MDPDKNYIASNEKKLIKEILLYSKNVNNKTFQDELKRDKNECTETYISGSKSYYKMLYEKVSKLYSLLLKEIGATKSYFDYQKRNNSNSLFQLLYKLKVKKDSSYNIEKAQKEFEKIKSSRFSDLTKHFQEIVAINHSSKIYYRYNSNCDITNYLSLEPFNLSKQSTLKNLSYHYDLAKWY